MRICVEAFNIQHVLICVAIRSLHLILSPSLRPVVLIRSLSGLVLIIPLSIPKPPLQSSSSPQPEISRLNHHH